MTDMPSTPPKDTPPKDTPSSGPNPTLTQETLDRLSGLAETGESLLHLFVLNKRREANWQTFKRAAIVTAVIVGVLAYAIFYGRLLGFQTDPVRDAVAVIPIRGPIAAGLDASAENIVPIIERACSSSRVNTIVLEIASPGGSPSEAERIIEAVNACRRGKPDQDVAGKPVIALIDSIGASAAYMIAMNTDEVLAGRYSLVGSIGAIMRYTDLSALANEHGIIERTWRSAPLKGGPSMLTPPSEEDDRVTSEMVKAVADQFVADVQAARSGKLTIATEQLASGRVWTATEAQAFGLVDNIATLEGLVATRFAGQKIHRYTTKPTFLQQLGMEAMVRQVMAEMATPQIQ
jgi:protease-4